jgi:hypothetical protein
MELKQCGSDSEAVKLIEVTDYAFALDFNVLVAGRGYVIGALHRDSDGAGCR